jgi:hypothetical protein
VNEYTRREEVRWTFIASLCLVLFIAPAVVLLVTARGKTVPDPAAKQAAKDALARTMQMHACTSAAENLVTEVDVFKAAAKTAHLGEPAASAAASAEAAAPPKKKKRPGRYQLPQLPKEKEPDPSSAWPAAQPSYKLARALTTCQVSVEGAVGVRAPATPGWAAIQKASAIDQPQEGDTKTQIDDAQLLLKLLGDAPLDKVVTAAREAEADVRQKAEAAQKVADTATIVEPIPEGVIPRRAALGAGIAICVIALVFSYFSVRAQSLRRLLTLVPLREAARTTHPGPHAVAILRLAAKPNGGEPGLVIGGALGGLAMAALFPADTDFFVVGVMGGLGIGFGVQWAVRLLTIASTWRRRATELTELEKPAIPVVLVLSGVNRGLEGDFIRFFTSLQPQQASETVEKLAAQAEEKILAAADAGRMQPPMR